MPFLPPSSSSPSSVPNFGLKVHAWFDARDSARSDGWEIRQFWHFALLTSSFFLAAIFFRIWIIWFRLPLRNSMLSVSFRDPSFLCRGGDPLRSDCEARFAAPLVDRHTKSRNVMTSHAWNERRDGRRTDKPCMGREREAAPPSHKEKERRGTRFDKCLKWKKEARLANYAVPKTDAVCSIPHRSHAACSSSSSCPNAQSWDVALTSAGHSPLLPPPQSNLPTHSLTMPTYRIQYRHR